MRLVTAILARNEASEDRYLRRVIANAQQWSDTVLVLDDDSTDGTVDLAKGMGCTVFIREAEQPAWGAEAQARADLWRLAAREAEGGWVLIQDADMLLTANPRPLCLSEHVNTWAWSLLDIWDAEETVHRVDGPWQGAWTPRPWLVCPSRVPEGWTPEWPERGIHCGHLPKNWPGVTANAPAYYRWLHLSYATPEHRAQKLNQYLSQEEKLTPFEKLHALSIGDAA